MTTFGDFGTTWTKIYNSSSGKFSIVRTRDLSKNTITDLGTGHNAELKATDTINELIALSYGGLSLIKDSEFFILDVGSRDMKYIHMKDGTLLTMDWNTNCGALTGFTLELLGSYFSIDFNSLVPSEKALPVTCGLLGIERIFDLIAKGVSIEEGVAAFTKGLALNAYKFINRRKKFYISGGMCDNTLFIKSFPKETEIIPLGRFVLVEGLKRYFNSPD